MRYQHFACATLLASCATARTLKQALAQHESLHMLSGILETLDLFSTFANARNTTLLAMTDTAIRFLDDWGIDLTTIDPDVARSILKYHFLEGAYDSATIERCSQAQLLHSVLRPPHFTNVTMGPVVKFMRGERGNSFLVESGLEKKLNIAESDIHYDGGIIHTIDSNLVLPHNLSETTNLGNLHEFWNLVEKSGSNVRLESLKDATYLIPSDDAIRKARLTLDKLTAAELADVVANHAVPNQVLYYNSVKSEGENHTTLYGESVTIWRASKGRLLVGEVHILRQDVLVYGGVAHIIDGVLLPRKFMESKSLQNTATKAIPPEANWSSRAEARLNALAWPVHLLEWPSITDMVFYAGLAAVLCGSFILRLVHKQEATVGLRRTLCSRNGDTFGFVPRTKGKGSQLGSAS